MQAHLEEPKGEWQLPLTNVSEGTLTISIRVAVTREIKVKKLSRTSLKFHTTPDNKLNQTILPTGWKMPHLKDL